MELEASTGLLLVIVMKDKKMMMMMMTTMLYLGTAKAIDDDGLNICRGRAGFSRSLILACS